MIALSDLLFGNLLYFGDGYVTDSLGSTVHGLVLLGAFRPRFVELGFDCDFMPGFVV